MKLQIDAMKRWILPLAACLSILSATAQVHAQRGGDRGSGGDRNNDRASSDRGSRERGDRGGDEDRGGRGGDERGSRGDEERSGRGGVERGGRGGGFGGPPGGGFGGGFGGPPGGGGGFGGGFSPVDMLKRFDRNGNSMIDLDEREGPAGFFISRLVQNNPRIDPSKPIPLDKLAEEMDRMRQERGGPPGASGGPSTMPVKPAEPEPLVPGFDKVEERPLVQGFGIPDPNSSIKIDERDLREAEDRISRYDTNKDGTLSKDELTSGRWSEDPMQFDRNGDGKINKSELAVRYAKRRLGEQAGQGGASQPNPGGNNDPRSRFAAAAPGGGGSPWGGRGGDRGGDNGGGWGSSNPPERGDAKIATSKVEAKSYRTSAAKDKANATKGMPDWFARSDVDGDGQVMMSEYSSTWTDEKVAEFLKFDLNSDGIITSRECLASLKSGGATSSSGIASSTPAPIASSSAASIVSGPGASMDDANRTWAKRQIEKYDKNKDGQLTVDEWSAMVVKPEGADADKNGIVTIDEFVQFRSGGK